MAGICGSLCLHLLWEEQPSLPVFKAGPSCRLRWLLWLQQSPLLSPLQKTSVLHIAVHSEARAVLMTDLPFLNLLFQDDT